MHQRDYRAGEVLFREDEPSAFACRLVSGEVDIIRHNEGEAVVLGTARAGEFVGEMGVIEARTRSATVRAVSAVTADIYPAEEFLRLVSEDSALALQLLTRLGERLKLVNDAFAEAVTITSGGVFDPSSEGAAVASPPLRLSAASPELTDAMPKDGIVVDGVLFVVGRVPDAEEARAAVPPDLALKDTPPYRLSRSHFAIVATDGGYAVRDLHSKLGTEVSGRGLGDMFGIDRTVLEPGETLVVAGGRGSPFSFRLEF